MQEIQTNFLAWLLDQPIAKIVSFTIIAIIAIAIIKTLQSLASHSINETSSRYRVRKVIGFIGYLFVTLLLVSSLSERFGQFTVFFGVAGAGIAFALQEVIISLAGWFAVSLGGFYRPGDRVQLGGIKGDVIDIGMLRTTLMETGDWVSGDNYNGRIVLVANSFVFKEPVFNYSGEFTFLWDELKLPVRFGSDWELAQKLIEAAVTEHTECFIDAAAKEWQHMVQKFLIEKARIEPLVTLSITDNWIEYTARYVVHFRQRRKTKDAIMRSLLLAFDKNKDKVAFASTTIELVAKPPDFNEK